MGTPIIYHSVTLSRVFFRGQNENCDREIGHRMKRKEEKKREFMNHFQFLILLLLFLSINL